MIIGEVCCSGKPVIDGTVVVVAALILGQGLVITIFDGFEFVTDAQEFVEYQKKRYEDIHLEGVCIQEISVKENQDIFSFSNVRMTARKKIKDFRQKWKSESV